MTIRNGRFNFLTSISLRRPLLCSCRFSALLPRRFTKAGFGRPLACRRFSEHGFSLSKCCSLNIVARLMRVPWFADGRFTPPFFIGICDVCFLPLVDPCIRGLAVGCWASAAGVADSVAAGCLGGDGVAAGHKT